MPARPVPRVAMTIVVMGYRNESTIVDAVASVVGQAAPEPFEVVVVTSGGDKSSSTVRSAFPEISVVESTSRLLPGGARNAGVAVASGDAVAFLAADCLAEPGWVAARLGAHRAGHPVVAGAMTMAPPRTPSAWAFHFDLYASRLAGRPPGPVSQPDPAAHGLSFARDALDRLGPFDADCVVGEDTDAARRLAALGVPIWFEPRVRTAHRGPQDVRALLADRYRRGGLATRVTVSAVPSIARGRAVVAEAALWVREVARTVRTGWRYGSGERVRLVLALPLLVAGRGAGLVGRCRDRRRPHIP